MDTPPGAPTSKTPHVPPFAPLADPYVPLLAPGLPQSLSSVDHSGFQSRSRPQRSRSLRIPSHQRTSSRAPQESKHSRLTSIVLPLTPATASAVVPSRRTISVTASRTSKKRTLKQKNKPSTHAAAALLDAPASRSHSSTPIRAPANSGKADSAGNTSSGSSTMQRRTFGWAQPNAAQCHAKTTTRGAEKNTCKSKRSGKHHSDI